MPHEIIFQALPDDPQAIRRALQDRRSKIRRDLQHDYDLAFNYLEGRQLDDIRLELSLRYPQTQDGDRGQEIVPIAVPIVPRFVSESASIYTHSVNRKIVLMDGEENESTQRLTDELNKRLEDANFDECMQRVDESLVLVKDSGLWFQVKSGKFRAVPVRPQNVFPVQPPKGEFFDPSDQNDYSGFIIQVNYELDTADSGQQSNMYAYSTPGGTLFYSAVDPYEPSGEMTPFENPHTWPQMVEDDNGNVTEQEAPLQMFTIWSAKKPVDSLMINGDADLAFANREISLQWSLLFDTGRLQGWDQKIMNVLNPQDPFTRVPHGSRFPVVLKVGETMDSISSTAPYTSLVDMFQSFTRSLAIAHQVSPNSFSLDNIAPASGFAKMIDDLPRIEARQERAKRLKSLEERLAWPRIASIGEFLGWDGFTKETLKNVKMVVDIDKLEFPRTIAEESAAHEFDLKHKLTTPARILAHRRNISIEDAEAEIAQNREAPQADESENDAGVSSPANQPPQRSAGALLGQLIGRKNAGQKDDG